MAASGDPGMRSGLLRHRVKLQKKIQGHDSLSGVTENWEDWKTVWASIDPVRGDEYWAAKQFAVEVTHKVTIRYQDGVTPALRILSGSREFYITAVLNPDERNERLVLMCMEVLPSG